MPSRAGADEGSRSPKRQLTGLKWESFGVVRREQYSDRPPRYEYHLTSAGKELRDVLVTLMRWGDRHLNAGDPPVRWRHTCGEILQPVVVCHHCGETVRNNVHSPTGRGAPAADDAAEQRE
ncbi:winged helix-turn-helix transcriptional regulator [Streptomyces sp. NPDC048389]|uniref:winged helix-turn-helix transcriptional regulator n=1 Tax=Streptomyces sp. NPDC048389 TaxID=3154622 RepID=UPI0034524E13